MKHPSPDNTVETILPKENNFNSYLDDFLSNPGVINSACCDYLLRIIIYTIVRCQR